MQNPNTNLAAEFFVASQLYRKGYNVTLTLGHTKEIDLIIPFPDGRVITIDVKGLKNKTNWPINPKLKQKNHYYVFVCYLDKIDDLEVPPEVFIVPSVQINKVLSKWSKTTHVNVFAVDYKRIKNTGYKDAWRLIK